MVSRRDKGQAPLVYRLSIAIVIGILLGCFFAIFFPRGLLPYNIISRIHQVPKYHIQVDSSCERSERIKMLKHELVTLSGKNSDLMKQVIELNAKLNFLEQRNDDAQKQIPSLGKQSLAGPSFDGNKGITPNKSINPRLAKLLEEVAVNQELIVALANSNVKPVLEVWFGSIKRVGISNYMVVALDDETLNFCLSNNVSVYERDPDQSIDSVARGGSNHAVSGLKFHILREFLQLGYSVLLSDIDIVYLQNPFDHLHRDADVEAMSDGHDNATAYGYNDVFDEPSMGWSRYAHTMRIWVFNSGFFYLRPTRASLELLDRVAYRMAHETNVWDQAVFNEVLHFPSSPGYVGLQASRRSMDFYLFMNSKVLFKTVRKDVALRNVLPVVVHVNYHPDKLERMKAVVEFYMNRRPDALDSFPDGSEW